MIKPRLYECGTTDFSNNGLGVLAEAIDCRVKQGIGSSVLEMLYPLSGRLAEYIEAGKIVCAQPEPDAQPQPYSVYRTKKTSSGKLYIYARHMCYNLDGVVVLPFESGFPGETVEKIKENRFPSHIDNPLTIETNMTGVGNFRFNKPTDAWSIVGQMDGSFLEIFGGEPVFDQFTLKLVSRKGADRGFSIKYGQNLITLEQEENISKCYSGVFAFYGDGTAPLRRAVVRASGQKIPERLLPVDLTETIGAAGGIEALSVSDAARAYLEGHPVSIPEIAIDVQLATLRGSAAYADVQALEKVCIGDTVKVHFPKLSISASSRVVETNYDCLRDRYDRVVVGSAKQSVADMIAQQNREIRRLKGVLI